MQCARRVTKRHKLIIFNICCFSTAKLFTRTCLNISYSIHCFSCYTFQCLIKKYTAPLCVHLTNQVTEFLATVGRVDSNSLLFTKLFFFFCEITISNQGTLYSILCLLAFVYNVKPKKWNFPFIPPGLPCRRTSYNWTNSGPTQGVETMFRFPYIVGMPTLKLYRSR